MRIGFIIAEYNPLHNGHVKHILQTKKQLNCDKIVCIMSGDFVQRGEFAVKDKYSRAIWAIKAGCDMVVELPVQYVLGSAQIFASGANKIIRYFDAEKYLSFGSECGNLEVLEGIKNILISDEFSSLLKGFLDSGVSYAKATGLAFEKFLLDKGSDKVIVASLKNILEEPNNILAIEYLKALSLDVTPFTIKRNGSYSDSLSSLDPSAMSIRKCMLEGIDYSDCVPNFVKNDLKDYASTKDKLFSIAKYELSKKQNLDKIYGMVEGLNNRFVSCLDKSNNYDEYMNNIKTKRYTQTALNRALLSALISNTSTMNSLMNDDLEYINILAINKESKDMLGIIENEVITKPSDLTKQKIDDPLTQKTTNLFKAVNYEYESYMRII